MSRAKEKGDNEVREEKEGKGDGGRSGSLMVGDEGKREARERSLLSAFPFPTNHPLRPLPELQPTLGIQL